ncbi:MAG: hypothetical protein ACRDPY_11970 [Streptosporangiaceae bacterium]
MDTTEWLIAATVAGPVLATLAAPGFTGAVLRLVRVRAQRVKHVEVSGTDLYELGVPMTEAQFRGMFAAYQAALDELPPPADRTDWDMARQGAAAQRVAVLTGTHPNCFPNIGDPDEAWQWYAENNPYVTGVRTTDPLSPSGRRRIMPAPPWQRPRTPAP